MFSGIGDCAHVRAGGGTFVSSSLVSGCSREGLHNVGLYTFTRYQDNTLYLSLSHSLLFRVQYMYI